MVPSAVRDPRRSDRGQMRRSRPPRASIKLGAKAYGYKQAFKNRRQRRMTWSLLHRVLIATWGTCHRLLTPPPAAARSPSRPFAMASRSQMTSIRSRQRSSGGSRDPGTLRAESCFVTCEKWGATLADRVTERLACAFFASPARRGQSSPTSSRGRSRVHGPESRCRSRRTGGSGEDKASRLRCAWSPSGTGRARTSRVRDRDGKAAIDSIPTRGD